MHTNATFGLARAKAYECTRSYLVCRRMFVGQAASDCAEATHQLAPVVQRRLDFVADNYRCGKTAHSRTEYVH